MTPELRQTLERAIHALEVVVVLGGMAVLLLVSVPWLEGPLDKIGLSSSDALRTGVVVLVLTALFFEVRGLAAMVRERESSTRLHFPDPVDVYPHLINRALAIKTPSQRTLDIIGMTLYTAWPSVSFWANRPETTGWTIRFVTLSADAGQKMLDWIPENWPAESLGNVQSIRSVAGSTDLAQRRMILEVYEYDFVPTVHGFRLGNGDLYVSILLWQEDGYLGKPSFSYDFISADEHSASADAYRLLFSSWFDRALESGLRGNPSDT